MWLFHVFVYCAMLIPLHFMCVQSVDVVLQRIDSCERVMFLLRERHIYFVCGSDLLLMFPSSVSSATRTYKASKPPAHVAAARGLLAENRPE